MTKGNVRYIDLTVSEMSNTKPLSAFMVFFLSAKKYNKLVEEKFASLDEKTKSRIYHVIRKEAKHRRKAWKLGR